ncbi:MULTISPECIES: RICIN domain-containing protein [unclassified Streptomyces]|uniref:RICIN domain-containing protein n=1 Tax=Streptomyces sp. NPDC127129 TaxID=3345373 RepID=UPI00363D2CB3
MPEEPIENPFSRWFEGPLINTGSQLALTPEGGANGEGSIVLRQFFGGPGQRWCVQPLDDGSIRILHTSSGKVLDVDNASMQGGARLICWPWHGGDNQRFTVNRDGVSTGAWVRAKHSNQVLCTDGDDGDPVTAGFSGATTGPQQLNIAGDRVRSILEFGNYSWVLQQTPPVSGTVLMTQLFDPESVQNLSIQFQRVPPSGLYRIAVPQFRTNDDPAGLPKVLDIQEASTANGARVILWDWHGGKNQLFAISSTGDHGHRGYTIRAEHSLKVIQIGSDGFAGIGSLVQADFTGEDNQTWLL